MAVHIIIPARYASTRFPGKPLALINGKPMIQHVYEAACTSKADHVCVATDDERIADCVAGFGGKAVMTSPTLPSGTDRCGEAARRLQLQGDDIVINVQGDEPFITGEVINLLIKLFENPSVQIATLTSLITRPEEVNDPNKVKVVFDKNHRAIYFSRHTIPYLRNPEQFTPKYFKHIGIYGYRYSTLQRLIQLPESNLEKSEKLEQLRWIENGYAIHVAECVYEGIGIDTPEDLERVMMGRC
jgi:3-deoxy-manno-octulosonate cytidylyltransferase (CMP-KDO synthetase)